MAGNTIGLIRAGRVEQMAPDELACRDLLLRVSS